MSGRRTGLPLKLRVRAHGSTAVVHAHGVIDLWTAPCLRMVLADLVEDFGQIVVDLGGVTLLDAHSVGMLVAARRLAEERRVDLWTRGATGRALRVLEISGVGKFLDEPGDAVPVAHPSYDRTMESLLRARIRQPGEDADRDALRRLAIDQGYRLAVALARRYRGRGEQADDLTQVAAVGLLKSVDGYKPDRGLRFHAYAVPTIEGELKRHFRDKGWHIRVPRRMQELRLELADAAEALTRRLGRSPTVAEIAGHVGTTEDRIVEAMEAARMYRPTSLSDPLSGDASDGQDGVVADRIGTPDHGFDLVENGESLRLLLAGLPARQRYILALYFYGNLTQTQIATEIGASQMQVSRLLSEALRQLREGLSAS